MIRIHFLPRSSVLAFIFFGFLSDPCSNAQFTDGVSVSWGIKNLDPVKVEVVETPGQSVRFNGINSTYYPFMLRIEFSNAQNLAPRPSYKEMEIKHGSNQIITLTIATKDVGYGYKYGFSYWLSTPEAEVERDYPYLVPLKEGTVPEAYKVRGKLWIGRFKCNPGDTVYCMRKGVVTAVPGASTNDFRVTADDALEVLHKDGTIMTYMFIDKTGSFASQGRTVLPGQPLGVASDSSCVMVRLMEFREANSISYIPIRYASGGDVTALFDAITGKGTIVHPAEVVTREMTKGEIKRTVRVP
jgi:hypothetical protein